MLKSEWTGIALLAVAAAACDEGARVPDSAALVRDSLGVRIAENPASEREVPLRPRSEAPLASFGSETPEASFQRITWARLLSDGRVVAVDFGPRNIREFASDGAFIREWARRGEGPGEVQFPSNLLRLPGDTLEVWDRRLARLYTYDPNGDLVRESSWSIGENFPPPQVERVGPSTWASLVVDYGASATVATNDIGQLVSVGQVLVAADVSGSRSDTIARRQHSEIQTESGSMFAALGSQSPWAAIRPGVVVGSGTDPEFEIRSNEGDLVAIVRWGQNLEPVSVDRLVEIGSELGPIDATHPIVQPEFLPDRTPAYKTLAVLDGRVWVGNATPFRMDSDQWRVFDQAGRWLATVDLGPGAEVMDHSGDRLLVRETDELGVQTLAVYRLALGDSA